MVLETERHVTISPGLILALVEGVLGYKRVERGTAQGSGWEYKWGRCYRWQISRGGNERR
jgi:hypothetical protein